MTSDEMRALIAEYEAQLASMPEPEPYRWWQVEKRGMDAITRTRLLGERKSLERLLLAARNSLEMIVNQEERMGNDGKGTDCRRSAGPDG